MGRFPKPCRVCGNLSLGNLCATHQAESDRLHNIRREQVKKATGQYSGDYRKRAAQVRATAIICHICGDGYRFNDPFEADHIEPGSPTSELRAAHRSCNQSRGNKPIN
jgi:hypothetical protein